VNVLGEERSIWKDVWKILQFWKSPTTVGASTNDANKKIRRERNPGKKRSRATFFTSFHSVGATTPSLLTGRQHQRKEKKREIKKLVCMCVWVYERVRERGSQSRARQKMRCAQILEKGRDYKTETKTETKNAKRTNGHRIRREREREREKEKNERENEFLAALPKRSFSFSKRRVYSRCVEFLCEIFSLRRERKNTLE